MIHCFIVVVTIVGINTVLACSLIIQHPRFINLRRKMFLAVPLRFLYSSYLEMLISVVIGLINLNWDKEWGYSMFYNNSFTIVLTIVVTLFPIFIIVVYYGNIEKLSDEKFRRRYGVLYDGLKY